MEHELKNKLSSLSPQQLKELVKKMGKEKKELPFMPRNPLQQYPVTSAQKRMWFLSKLDPHSHLYTNPIGIRVKTKADIDMELYVHGFHKIVQRHEIMRTSFFSTEGRIMQQIHEHVPVHIEKIDLSTYPEEQKENMVNEVLVKEGQSVINIEDFPLFTFKQLVLSEREFVLLYNSHHIISDAWSSSHIFREMQALYECAVANTELPLPKYQFIDYVHWENSWMETDQYRQTLSKWKTLLPAAPEPLHLPLDFVRPPVINYEGALEKDALDADFVNRLSEFSKSENVNLFHTLLATFNILLHKYSRNEEIVVGIPFANRKLREFQQTVGMFLNTLPHRTVIDTSLSFRAYLQQVRQVSQDMVVHQDFPFEKIVEEINPPRDVAITPVFQVLFVFQNIPHMYQWENLEVSPVKPDYHISKYEINLWIEEVAGGLFLSLTHQVNLFKRETIQRFLRYYRSLLESVITNADCAVADLIVNDEAQHIVPPTVTNDGTYIASFEKHAAMQGDALALVCGETRLTYRNLNEQANQLAHYLLKHKREADKIIAFILPRSVEQVISILAIHKAGCAYLPIDASTAAERVKTLIEDAGVNIVITEETFKNISENETGSPGILVQPHDLAYLLYTSGTTGLSKGVCIEHAQLFNYSQSVWKRFKLDRYNVFATVSGITTDLGNTQIFPALMHGAAVDIVPETHILNPVLLSDYIQQHDVDCLKIVPSHLAGLLRAHDGAGVLPRKLLITGGEKLTASLVQEIKRRQPGLRIINHYGPTETTIGILTHEVEVVEHNTVIPLGTPLENNNVLIVDDKNRIVPDGLPGEIVVCGVNVGRGYHNNEELTKSAFAGRCYKTGDIGRKNTDGNIEFLGRKDRQLKIRGHRIEPEAIERVILADKTITGAVVTGDNGLSLIAYITLADEGAVNVHQLKQSLQSALPSHMVPNEIVVITQFPRHANGKIDLRSLEKLKAASLVSSEEVITPLRDEIELGISNIWKEVLKTGSISPVANFFHIGGTSLVALEVIAKVNQQFGTEFGPAVLFEAGTIQSIAALIRKGEYVSGNKSLLLLKKGTSDNYLFLVHPAGGDVLSYYELALRIDESYHVYGLQSTDFSKEDESIEVLASGYVQTISRQLPQGNYAFGGWSMGAIVAYEMALQWQHETGQCVPVIVLDQQAPANINEHTKPGPVVERQVSFARKIEQLTGRSNHLNETVLIGKTTEERTALFLGVFKESGLVPDEIQPAQFQGYLDKFINHSDITARYHPASSYEGRVTLIKAKDTEHAGDSFYNWRRYAITNLKVEVVPGNHVTIIRPPYVQAVAEKINFSLHNK
jgi:amino acid adenylation domain-containing protein